MTFSVTGINKEMKCFSCVTNFFLKNLPGHLIRVVGRVQAILTAPNAPSLSEDCYAWLLQTYDRIAINEVCLFVLLERFYSSIFCLS